VNGRKMGIGRVMGFILSAAVLAAVANGASTAVGTAKSSPPTRVPGAASAPATREESLDPVVKSDAEWQRVLTADQYRVLRKAGTEVAFTGKYWNNHKAGIYRCAGCGLTLFESATKFESGTGWPSFWQPVDPSHVKIVTDDSYGMVREEVRCARCGGHLGHRFDDGPQPTGQRYCMNSVSLDFTAAKK